LSHRADVGELFRQHPIEVAKETGKALDMKKAVFALATASTLGVTALVTPSPAQAWRGGWGPGLAGGLIVGAVIGGAIASSAYAYGPGYGYYGGPYYPGYGYYPGYVGDGPYYRSGPWQAIQEPGMVRFYRPYGYGWGY